MKSRSRLAPALIFSLLTSGLVACSPAAEPGTGTGTGGSSGSGGAPGSGGASPSSGGASGTGGANASGGASASGGSTASGGSSATGGATATGGSSASGGASAGTGGAAGSGNGGRGGSRSGGAGGGATATGGAGGGGSGTGGASGGGGSAGQMSAGCGSASPLKSGNFTETIDGTQRKYTIDVPTTYDTNKPYRLIFVWHPLGGNASGVVNGGYNGLKSLSGGSAVLVAPDGLQGSNQEASGNGWWNTNGRDMKFAQAMLDKLSAGLCIDKSRIFSTGFSFGGMMSYAVGFELNAFRAIAPCSGDVQVIMPKETYTEPLPIMAFHGNNDTFVTTARGRAARDRYLARNKCGTQTMAVSPSPCVQYQGCAAPTYWCEFPGGHNTWSEEPAAIWKFFSQF